jgi:FMN phosphatase YigB (HAD superfamily)
LSKHFKILVPLTNMDHASYNGTLSGPLNGCPFTTSYIAEDIGSYKPDLANFHYLFDHLKADYGVEKNDICHVAQSLFHDHEPSKKVGLRSVWVDRYGIFQGMDREWEDVQKEYGMKGRVGSLGELADLVARSLGSS